VYASYKFVIIHLQWLIFDIKTYDKNTESWMN
jgi:hypothetical protein